MEPTGYSYYLRGALEATQRGNAYLVGDSVGLATRFLGEGIGPAIRSGLRAAESILTGKPYQISDVTGASLGNGWVSRSLEWLFSRGLEPAASACALGYPFPEARALAAASMLMSAIVHARPELIRPMHHNEHPFTCLRHLPTIA